MSKSIFILFILVGFASAVTRTWNGSGASDNWTTAANWVGSVAPSAGDDIVFAGTTRLTPNNDFTSGTTFNSISFSGGSGPFVIGGNSLQLSGGATAISSSVSSGVMTISNAITITTSGATIATTSGGLLVITGAISMGSFALTVSSNGNTELDGIISGSGNLTKSGTGNLVLYGANTYSGSTSVSSGKLILNNASALGSTSGGTTISTGAAMDLHGQVYLSSENLTLNGLGPGNIGALVNDSAAPATYAGNITLGTAASIKGGGGTIDISGSVSASSLNLTLGGGAGGSISGVVGIGTGSLTKQDPGTWTLSGSNTYTGITIIADGILSVNTIKSVSAGSSALGAPTTAGNGTIALGSTTTTGTLVYTGAVQSTDRVLNLAGTTGGGSVDQSGSGTLTFTSALTATGVGSKILTLQGSTASGGVLSGTIVNGSGTTAVTKAGTGTWTLSGANTYTGGTNLNAGTINVNSTTALGGSASTLTIAAGMTLDNTSAGSITLTSNNPQTWTGNFTFSGSQALNIGTGAISLGSGARQITVSASTLTLGGVISGTGGITKAGTGTLMLNGINTYSGATTVNAGTLAAGSSQAFGSNSAVTLINAAGALLNITGFSTSIGSLAGGGGSGGDVTLGAATLTVGGDNSSPGPYSGIISGTGGVTKTGTGTLTLSGSNTYTGTTTVNAGTLAAGSTQAFGVNSAVTIANAASTSLNITGFSNSIGSLTGGGGSGGNVILGAAALTIGGDGTSPAAYAGVLSGTGAMTKTGSGTLALTGTNTYTGATTVSSGTLQIGNGGTTGALSSSSGITNNATLAFNRTNTITQGTDFATVIAGTGAVAQMGAAGTLILNGTNTYTGATTINSGSTLKLGAAGVIYDGSAVTVNGTLDLGGYTEGIGSLAGSGTVNNTSGAGTYTLSIGSDGTSTTFSGTIGNSSGTVDVTKLGGGTLTLSGANTYGGQTTISSGKIKMGSASALGSTSGGTTIASGWTLDLNGQTVGAEAITVNGTGISSGGAIMNGVGTSASLSGNITLASASSIVAASGQISLTGSISGTFDLTLSGSANGTLSGIISTGTGSLTKAGTGSWTLSGANTYTGSTTVNAGTLAAGSAQAFGVNSAVTLANVAGTSLDITGYANSIGSLTGGGATGGDITLGAATLTIGGDNSSPGAYAGVISGTGYVTKSGTGTLTLSGANTYTGSTSVNAGSLKLGSTSALGSNASGTYVSTGANLDLNGQNYTTTETLNLNGTGVSTEGALINTSATPATFVGQISLAGATSIVGQSGTIALSNTGTISGAAFGLTLGGSSGGTFAGVLGSGTGDLTKVGTGTWTLSSANSLNSLTLTAGVLNLGTGLTHIVSNTLSLTGGELNFGSSTLGVQAATVDLHLLSTLTPGTGTLNFIGSSAQTFTPKAGSTFPSIAKSGSGTVVLVSNNLSTANLDISAGAFDISTNALTITASGNLQVNGGFLDAGSGSLGIAGNVTFSSGTVTNPSGSFSIGGSYTHSGATVNMNSGTVVFNGTATGKSIDAAGSFNNLTLNGIGGAWTATSHLTVNGTFAMTAGTLDLSTNVRTLTVNTFNQTGGTISSSTGDMDVNGNFTMTAGTLTCPGGARVFYAGGNFAQTGGSLTPGSGTITFDATATGKTVNILSTVNNLTFAGSGGGWTLVTNGITGSALTLTNGALNLGASLIHIFTASPSFTGGSLDFGSSTLRLAGGTVNFNSLSGVTAGTGTLEFTGSSAQAFTPKSTYTLPQILQSGTGTTTLSSYDLLSGNLNVTAGEFNIGTRTVTVSGNLAVSTGTLTASNGALVVNGNVSMTSGTLSAPSGTFSVTGSLTIASGSTLVHNNGTLVLNGTATGKNLDIFPTLYNLTVNGSGGAWTVVNNPLQVASILSLTDGGLDMGSLTHSIGSVTSSGGVATLDFGTSTLNVTVGNAVFSGLATLTAGASSTLGFTAASGIQSVEALAATTHPHITHTGAGTLRLMNASMLCRSFTQSAGTINFNSYNFTTNNSGNFTLNNGTSTSISGLVGRIVTVAGNATLSGASSSDRLDLNPGSPWYLRTTGTASVSLASVDYSDASGYSTVTCSNCANGGSTTNWTFGVTWTGGGGDANWTTATNWASNSVPTSLDAVIFNSTATAATLDAAASVKSISFTSGYTGTFSFSSNTLSILNGNADFSSGGTLTAGTGTLAFTSSSAQTFIPKSGATFPTITQNGAGGTTITINALTAGNLNLTSGTLNLGAGFTHTVAAISGAGGLDFASSNLNATGNVNLSSATITATSSNTLTFTGSSAQTYTPKSSVTALNLTQNGAGGTTVSSYDFTTPTLTITAGTLNLGTSRVHTVSTALTITGGGLDFSSSTFKVAAATVNLNGLTTLSNTSGTLEFSGGSAQTFTPKASTTHPSLNQNGAGGTTIATNNLTADVLTITSGTFALGTGLTHQVTALATTAGTLNFGTSTLQVSGDANLAGLSTLTPGTGILALNKSSGTQILTPKVTVAHPAITHNSAGTLQLATNTLNCASFSQNAGSLDFNGRNITTTGNFTVTNGTATTFTGITGRTLTVGGAASFTGTSSANRINLNPGAAWTLTVTGALTGSFASVDFSDASTSTGPGTCTSCANMGSNNNWIFNVGWDGGAGDGLWSSANNWTSDYVPATTDVVSFNATSSAATLDVAASVKAITFTSGYTGTFSFSSNTLTINSGNADFQSGGAITAGTGALAFTGSSAQTFIPKSGATFPALIINNSSGVTLSTNNLVSGDLTLTSGSLTLGTGMTHAVSNISPSAAGGIIFGNSTLQASGSSVSFANLGTLNYGTGTLELTGTSAQTFTGKNGVTQPNIKQNGSGGTTLLTNNWNTGTLTIASGILNLGTSLTVVANNFSATGGGLDFGSSTLEIDGATVNFTSLSSITPGTGTLFFGGASAQTFTPKASTTHPNIKQYGTGGTTLATNGLTAGSLTLNQGTFNLGTSLSHSFTSVSDGGGGPYGNLDFNSSQLHVTGNVTLGNVPTLTVGSGTLDFNGTGATQLFTPKSSSANHPAITHSGSATVQLTTNPLSCLSFSQSAGQWDFNGLNLNTTSTGNFTVTNGTTSSFAGLAGRTLTVAGVTSLTGTSTGNLLNLNPGATWTLSSSGTLTATLASLNYSNASGSAAAGTCVNCSDGGNNTNWSTAVSWDGGGADNNWSTVGNWGLDAVPTSSDNIIFDATSVKNLTLDVAGYVNSIKFTSGYTGSFNFSSNTLAITSGNADFRSGGAIIAGTGALAFTGTSAQTFVPKSGATFPALIQNGTGGTTIITNALTAGDVTLTSGTLNLGAGFTHTVAGVSGAGGLNFATSNLNTSGNVNLSSATITASSSNTLAFTGTTGQTYTPKASVTALNLTQNGTGGTTVSTYDFTTPTLTISTGILNLGTSRTHTVSTALTITGGGLDFSSSTFKVAATTVNLSGLASLSNSTGTLEFNGASAQTFTPKASTSHPSLNQNGAGGTTVVTNNLTADVLTITSGTFALGTGLTHQVTALATTAGELSFGTSTLQVSGDANLAGLTTLTPGTGTLAMNKSSGTQILTPKVTGAHPALTHNSAGTLQLAANALNCASFSQNSGVLDFNSRNITTTGNFTVTNGTSTTLTGLAGRTLTVGGAASFTGTSSANRINLNPGAAWTLTITGALTGSFASVDFSDASSSTSPGTCTSCANMGSNTNWIFSLSWVGGGGNSNWTTAANWSSNSVPTSVDAVSFNSTSSNATLDAAASVKSIVFTSGYTGTFNFSTNTLTVHSGNADFRSGGSITAGTGALAFTGTLAQTFIPKSGATFPAILQNGTGGTTLSTNNLMAGNLNLTSGTLNLGSGLTHSVASISGSGGLDFSASNISASGNVDLSGLTVASSVANTLEFSGSSAQTYTPKSSVTALNLKQNGIGGTTIASNDFTTSTLTIAVGTFNLGTSHTHTVSTALTITGGVLDFSSSTLKVAAATVNLNALTALAFTTGILEFSGASAQTFTPKASTSLPALLQSGAGGTTVATNPINSATLTLTNGIFNLGTSLTHTIANFTSIGGGLDFSSSTLNVTSGNADLSGLASLTAASGKLVFNAASGSQTLTPKAGTTLPGIEHNAAGMLILTANDLICSSFRNQAGRLDLNGRNITVASTGYFEIFNGNATTFANLTGRTISVNGNATLLGQAGSHLNLNPASAWTLHVTGTLNAIHADIQNSASTGTMGQADSSINLLGNTNWNFLDSIKPDNVTGLLATKISGHGIQLLWTASASSDADSIMLRYRTNGSYPANQTDGTFFRTVKANKSSDTAFSMADKAIYHFAAFVKDSSGNWSLPSSAANDSAWLPDVTPPASVTAFLATAIGPTTAALAWVPSISTDADTTIIRYRLDGVYPTGPTDGTLWKKLAATANKDTVTGLTTNTVYHFGAFVRDTSGNYTVASTATQDSSLYQTPITGTITIADVAGRTKNPVPGLAFTATGADSLRFSLLADTAVTTAWKSMHATDSLNMAVGADGPRIALVQFKNTFGRRSMWMRDTTVLDRVAPVMTLNLNATHSYKNWPGYITGKALDATTGTDSIFVVRLRETDNAYYNGSGWTSIPDTARLRSDSAFNVPMPASALDSGFYHFSAYAKDKVGNIATLLDKRVLYEANRNPVLAASTVPDTTLQNMPLNMYVDIGDLDLDDSVKTITVNIPTWLTSVEKADSASAGFAAHRVYTLTGTPAQAQVGSQTLNIQVEDLGGKIFNYSKTFLVKDVNDAPVFAAGQSTLSVQEDSVTAWAPLYSDPDPKDVHTLTLISAPKWIQLKDTVLTFHPGNRDVGNYTFQITVSDGSLFDTLNLALIVLNVNDGPVAFPSANWQSPVNWKEDILDTFTVVVVDMDKGDAITLVTPLPAFISYVASTDSVERYNHFFKFSVLPRPMDTGSINIDLIFSDQAGATTKLPLQAKVLFVNDAPLAIIKTKQNMAGAAKFSFDVSDEDGTLSATRFHYRLVGPAGDTVRSGITASSILSLKPLVDGNYQIAVLAEDQGGLKQKGYTLSSFTINGASSLNIDTAHWNMVAISHASLPATVLGVGAEVTNWDESGEDGQVLGRYSSGVNSDSLKRGKGYWVRVNKPITLNVSQKDLLDLPFTLKLNHGKQGWNQIGNPFPYFIDLSSTNLQFWEWDAMRRDLVNTKGILKPWGAYWVQVSKDTILTLKNEPYFPVPGSTALTKTTSFQPSYQHNSNWSLQLALQAGPFQDRLNFIGIHSINNSIPTLVDVSDGSSLNTDAPKYGEYIALHFHKPGTLGDSLAQNLAADFREKLDAEEEWWDFTVENSGTGLQNASLQMAGLDQVLHSGLYAFLVHRGESVPVTSEVPVLMAMEGTTTQYSFVITPHADFAERLKGNFNITQNFPNPVVGQTSFRFFLPQNWDSQGRRLANRTRLRINVFDYSGRLSAQVTDGFYKPGGHTLLWNPISKNGSTLAKGAYLYRLETPGFTKTLKMVIK